MANTQEQRIAIHDRLAMALYNTIHETVKEAGGDPTASVEILASICAASVLHLAQEGHADAALEDFLEHVTARFNEIQSRKWYLTH